jgi:hypothetical protein
MNEYGMIPAKIKWNKYPVLQTDILKNIRMLECQNIGILEQQAVCRYNPMNNTTNR